MLLPVAFSLPPCSTFADHIRSFNLRSQETATRIFEDAELLLDLGKKIHEEGDIYYR